MAISCEEPTHWKRPWCCERLKAGGEIDNSGWDSWMESLTQWTWVWANSRRWWRTEKPGMLQSTGLQRAKHDQGTEQQHPWHSLHRSHGSHTHPWRLLASIITREADYHRAWLGAVPQSAAVNVLSLPPPKWGPGESSSCKYQLLPGHLDFVGSLYDGQALYPLTSVHVVLMVASLSSFFFFFVVFFKLEYNCFTMLCVLNNHVSQWCIHAPPPAPTHLGHHRAPGRASCAFMAGSHWLFSV